MHFSRRVKQTPPGPMQINDMSLNNQREPNAQRLYAMRQKWAHYKDCGIRALRAKWILCALFVQAVATVLPQGRDHT